MGAAAPGGSWRQAACRQKQTAVPCPLAACPSPTQVHTAAHPALSPASPHLPPPAAAPAPARLKRLGRGEKELARSDFQMIPELAGNPFLPRIFEMYDQDGDGYMNARDLRSLLDSLTALANEEARFQCERGAGGRVDSAAGQGWCRGWPDERAWGGKGP